MSEEDYVAVLNPFSEEGKRIVGDSPPFDSFPERIVDLAVEGVDERSGSDVVVDFDDDEIRDEVLSFYLMAQSIASVSYPYSNETQAVIESTRDKIRYRMFDLFRKGYGDICIEAVDRSFRLRELEGEDNNKIGSTEIPMKDIYTLRDLEMERDGIEAVDDGTIKQYLPRYAIHWTDLTPLIEHRKMDLTDQYIVDGWALITPKNLWSLFANYVSGEMEDYISELYDKFSDAGPPDEIFEEAGERISETIPEEEKYKGASSAQGGELRHDAFPPCVKKVLSGVPSGNRNYGIVVLLTSFLSYARISPSGKSVNRVADFIEDISTIEEDIMPLIEEAAENCKPPLFEDQPEDKPNVYYHMGFGMTTKPKLGDSGKSKWYRPPNCRKIKTEAPALCNPDEDCSEVKNPLTYYYKHLSSSSNSEE